MMPPLGYKAGLGMLALEAESTNRPEDLDGRR
jgi:hypothetical protein